MPLVEKRYAEALIEVAAQQDGVEAFMQDLQTVSGVFEENRDFRLLLLNPCIGGAVKKDIASRLFADSIRPEVLNLFMLLLDKRRIRGLSVILREYVKLADKKMNVLRIRIISSAAIEQDQAYQIQEKFREIYGATSVRAEFGINPQLVGGVRVIAGDRLTDGTVRGRLDSLKEALLKG